MKNLLVGLLALTMAGAAVSAQSGAPNPLVTARVFAYEQMKEHIAPNGAEGRRAFTGTLATGEVVGVHESMQPAGAKPNPPHRIQHSEIIVVEQGTVVFEHDGKAERAGAGSVIYVAYGTLHTLKDVGDGPAKYVVVQIGGDTDKK